jgi:hypothetical protein
VIERILAVGQLADSDRNSKRLQLLPSRVDLVNKGLHWKDTVEEWLRAELDTSGHERRKRVRLQRCEQGVASAHPLVAAIKAELKEWSVRRRQELNGTDPDQGVNAKIGIVRRLYDVIAEHCPQFVSGLKYHMPY